MMCVAFALHHGSPRLLQERESRLSRVRTQAERHPGTRRQLQKAQALMEDVGKLAVIFVPCSVLRRRQTSSKRSFFVVPTDGRTDGEGRTTMLAWRGGRTFTSPFPRTVRGRFPTGASQQAEVRPKGLEWCA